MTLINAMGWVLLLMPFATLFAVVTRRAGLVSALMIYVCITALVLTMYIGATLAGFE